MNHSLPYYFREQSVLFISTSFVISQLAFASMSANLYYLQVLTFIRPGTMPGLLLSMIKELPYNQRSEEYMPLSRVQIYSAEDDSMSLNLFVYGEEAKQLTEADVTMTGEKLLGINDVVCNCNECVE
jgi:hypothetical protein